MLTKQQMLNALDELIIEADRLYQQFLKDFKMWTGDFASWLKACESTIEVIFGSTSEVLRSFKGIYFSPPPGGRYTNELEATKANFLWFASGLSYAHSTLIGYRYAVERLAATELSRPNPYNFISHGGPTRTHVDAVQDFLSALGLAGIVVADLPNLNLSVNEKVLYYMSLCAGGIALATTEDETTACEHRTRPNVENEIGMMQMAQNIGNRIIYLKEPEVQFASNYREKVWLPFRKERVQDAFTAIARELRAFGFLI